jgi:hypothetical protein
MRTDWDEKKRLVVMSVSSVCTTGFGWVGSPMGG